MQQAKDRHDGSGGQASELGVTLVSGFVGVGKSTVVGRAAGDREGASIRAIALAGSTFQPDAIAALAADGRCEHVLVECPAAGDPVLIAAAIQRARTAVPLRLDRVVTVVDAQSFMATLECLLDLSDLGLAGSARDTRTVAGTVVAQVEFAQSLIVNRAPELGDVDHRRLLDTLRVLNPSAQIVVAPDGRVARDVLVGGGGANVSEISAGAGWRTALRTGALPAGTPEQMGAVVFRSRRPFDEERLWRCVHGGWKPVLRGRGVFWLAQRPELVGRWSQVRRSLSIEAGYPCELEPPGDDRRRRTELVLIGEHLDPSDMHARLSACVLNDTEMACGRAIWQSWPERFPSTPDRVRTTAASG